MGNTPSTASRLSMRCGSSSPPPYEPHKKMTDRDLVVQSAETVLSRKTKVTMEQYEVVWAAMRNSGVLVYHGPRHLTNPRVYAMMVAVVQGYDPATGQEVAVFNPVSQRLTWHEGIPLHTPTWSVTTRWWRSEFGNKRDPFLAELVAKQSSTPIHGISADWADELCRVISQNWHIHAHYNVMGSEEVGFWVTFD
jgi:hypothetical protein